MVRNWTAAEDAELGKLVRKYGRQWNVIASHMKDRSAAQVLARWEKCLDPVIVKGPFTEAEDELIREYVKENGPQNWPRITSFLPNRSPKQCRERWFNHLDPSVVKHAWTPEEDETIFRNHQKLGPKWSVIAKMIPGRTDNAIKNRWNSSISKRIQINPVTHKETLLPDHSKKRKQGAVPVKQQQPDQESADSPNSPVKDTEEIQRPPPLILTNPLTPPITPETPKNSNGAGDEKIKPTPKRVILPSLLASPHAIKTTGDLTMEQISDIPNFDPFSIPSPLFKHLDNSRLASPAPPIPGFSQTPGAFGGLISPSALATAPLTPLGALQFH